MTGVKRHAASDWLRASAHDNSANSKLFCGRPMSTDLHDGRRCLPLNEGIDATAPHPRSDRRVRARPNRGTREGRPATRQGARETPWATTESPDDGRHSGRLGAARGEGVGRIEEHGRPVDRCRSRAGGTNLISRMTTFARESLAGRDTTAGQIDDCLSRARREVRID
jgi:hypothetical protein